MTIFHGASVWAVYRQAFAIGSFDIGKKSLVTTDQRPAF